MRSNGLTAAAYTPIADIDPRIVSPLLDELKQHGVAAYVTPVETSSTGAFERPEFRTEVRDRLYVDVAFTDAANELLTGLNDEIDTTSEDLAWAQIVSGYDQPRHGEAPWPSTEDVSDADESATVAGDAEDRSDEMGYDDAVRRRTQADDEAPHPTPTTPAPDDGAEAFVPPPPPPLPHLEPRKQVAWLGVVGGPLLLLVSVLFGLHLPAWLSTLAVGGFVVGFVALVVMMGGDDEDSGWDDGAVV